MHWRGGLCRGEVQRTGWAAGRVEAALVYCASGHCVAVPTICGNVARVDFTPHERAQQGVSFRHVPIHPVPEPGTLLLAVAGLASLLACGAKRPTISSAVVSSRSPVKARALPPARACVRRGVFLRLS